MSTSLHTIIVALGLPQGSVARLIERVHTILEAMAANTTTFPSPTPTLAVARAHLAALIAAHADFQTHKAPVTDRDACLKAVVGDVSQLHSYVQGLVNVSPPERAEAIAACATMTLRKRTVPQKPPLAIRQLASASVRIVAKAPKDPRGHYWQYSLNEGQTWMDLPPTTQAATTLHGITPGALVFFRHRVLLRTGLGDWGDAISARVV